MDELASQLEAVMVKAKDVEKKWDSEIDQMKDKLMAILFGPTTVHPGSTTPQQIKKKKRLTAITDTDEEESFRRSSILSNRKNSVEMANIPETPTCPSPNLANTSSDISRSVRPARAAKLKAGENMKEPSISSKLRRPTLDSGNSFCQTNVTIKKEKEEEPKVKKPQQTSNRKKSSLESNASQRNADEPSKKVDESLVIISNKPSLVELISEDDESEKMPPPAALPKKNKKKKFDNVVVKLEKKSLDSICSDRTETTVTNDIEMAEPSETFTAKQEHNREENEEQDKQSTSSKSSASKKTKKSKHQPIKVERFSDVANAPSSRTRKLSKDKKSLESVYEDAITGDVPKSQPEQHQSQQPVDATFVSAKDASIGKLSGSQDATFVTNAGHATFVANPAQSTFVMDSNPNATVTVQTNKNDGDATYNVNAAVAAKDDRSSLLTDDESFEIPLAQLPKNVAKAKSSKMDLFSPCVQSPVKKMVEAFEKAAVTGSPPQRQTRTKTRNRTKENDDAVESVAVKELKSSTTTPLIGKLGPNLGRFLTPTQSSNITPVIGNMLKKLPSSTSKLMTFPKANFGSTNSVGKSSTSSLSRENSVEDLKRGYNKMQQLADERKKKRELKQQQAAQTRDQKEKERADRLKKLLDEREEKQRKKAQESDQKKRELEEINKNLKQQEEKRDAQKRLERQRLEREMAESARKEREHLEHIKMLKAKKEIQLKMQEQRKAGQVKKQNKYLYPVYDVHMLHSDDSTDDEGKTTHKRPPPPSWSLTANRGVLIERQSTLPPKIIDSFFSVQPMTIDLKEIFPAIDPKYLKRNSSVIWRTPPRYSLMPKY